MSLDWTAFDPWPALLGGGLIGLGASLFMLCNGRIAGISGLLGSLLQKQTDGRGEKVLFLLGLLLAPLLWPSDSGMAPIPVSHSIPLLCAAGLLVGLGTRYASGCTSGHGVCGLSRLSLRSLIATLCFMASGFATLYLVRHGLGG